VHSGRVTDALTLFSLQGTHFVIAKDGHGGAKVRWTCWTRRTS
jgi:hypothetical protein